MRESGRVAAAIAILKDFDRRRVPLKTATADWARNARYAGAKDRAWISGLCLDVLRKRRSLGAAVSDDTPRAAVFAALKFLWGWSLDDITALAAEEPHGPGALTENEIDSLSAATPSRTAHEINSTPGIAGNFPEWLTPSVDRVFGAAASAEMQAFAARADVDLRLNTLRAPPDRALDALKSVGAVQHLYVSTAARVVAPDSTDRSPAITVIPAFNKGWVEVQDVGSQIAALCAGAVRGAQVLDFCAGGGGKTLALAALMENKGQLFAYDRDARRLQPLYERARRAGVRNLQIINPLTDKKPLDAITGKMDVVFIDAPCTGSGTWRRHPDTKWRLTNEQLARRMEEQDAVLREAAPFVKPGGRLVYATCSFLMEENEDRLSEFLADRPDFEMTRAIDQIAAIGLLTDDGCAELARCETPSGAVRLTPARIGADGFFVATLKKSD